MPVVAGDGGGAPETVRPSETGIVVNGRRIDEVVDAIAGLLDEPQRAVAMGQKGREYIQKEWSWSVRGPQLAQVLFDGLD